MINPENKAKEIFEIYNHDDLVPFPVENILREETSLEIRYRNDLDVNLSGAILYLKEIDKFIIIINSTKAKTRQYFTIAHELGHFYLHKDLIKKDEGFIDGENTLDNSAILFRDDQATSNEIEREANRFAAALIMPERLVKNAWRELRNVDKCADVFGVSVLAMSIRLEKLGIPT
jgi:Zn-dependent peptidase ImmA (M78 family)